MMQPNTPTSASVECGGSLSAGASFFGAGCGLGLGRGKGPAIVHVLDDCLRLGDARHVGLILQPAKLLEHALAMVIHHNKASVQSVCQWRGNESVLRDAEGNQDRSCRVRRSPLLIVPNHAPDLESVA